jgi:hypothetical protein
MGSQNTNQRLENPEPAAERAGKAAHSLGAFAALERYEASGVGHYVSIYTRAIGGVNIFFSHKLKYRGTVGVAV